MAIHSTCILEKSPVFSALSIASQIRDIINNYDIVMGTIVDDRMNEAIDAFNDNTLTDEGLMTEPGNTNVR